MSINDLRLDFNAFRINYKGQWYKKKKPVISMPKNG